MKPIKRQSVQNSGPKTDDKCQFRRLGDGAEQLHRPGSLSCKLIKITYKTYNYKITGMFFYFLAQPLLYVSRGDGK